MPIRFRCPYCNQLLTIAGRKAGTQVDCPTCAGRMTVPSHVHEAATLPEPSRPGLVGDDRSKPFKSPALYESPQQMQVNETLAFATSPQRDRFSHNDFECISLANLVGRMQSYDRLPIFIQWSLRYSVLITIVVNLFCIPILWLLPAEEWALSPISPNGFFLGFTSDVVNFLLRLAYTVAPYLLVLNVTSLLLTTIVLVISYGFSKRVDETVHWLAWSAALPSGASALSTVVLVLLFMAIVVLTLIIWIVIICLVLAIIGAILACLGDG